MMAPARSSDMPFLPGMDTTLLRFDAEALWRGFSLPARGRRKAGYVFGLLTSGGKAVSKQDLVRAPGGGCAERSLGPAPACRGQEEYVDERTRLGRKEAPGPPSGVARGALCVLVPEGTGARDAERGRATGAGIDCVSIGKSALGGVVDKS
ncbi:hypothetical protein FHS40_004742 [Streptomyces spectabilis]|uniref:Uncharacterized protein n=1 Tax=Streptomyces spectabilis TaxID=68270 RepID=A0A7W8AW68_STRST|nr:hypothetical protein [Streptomyces spectabilis]